VGNPEGTREVAVHPFEVDRLAATWHERYRNTAPAFFDEFRSFEVTLEMFLNESPNLQKLYRGNKGPLYCKGALFIYVAKGKDAAEDYVRRHQKYVVNFWRDAVETVTGKLEIESSLNPAPPVPALPSVIELPERKRASAGSPPLRMVEEQIKELAACDIHLREGISVEDLLESINVSDYEAAPYRALLEAMGGPISATVLLDGSPDIWHFDTECIEDEGDYARIANKMKELAQGALPLENITDHVDLEGEVAWLSVDLDGVTFKWDADVNTDWVDPAILSLLAELLRSRNAGRRFTNVDLGGQSCLIGCSTDDALQRLIKTTGMPFEWLN